ncbi:hypothetical protein [Mongoliitalea lutea]|uniref:Uncharacterized protein n=1 Tax=Mongoliitalea lutea TaxID=849756 RepID=A0A8J3G6F0_9BACT|nr:hypothetical protein [Mongoliitalea lutea]GHB44321.1 hypothetical protein GCM10008106_26700 [Mongoliitalea lutea]
MSRKAFKIETTEGPLIVVGLDEFAAHDAARDYLRQRNLTGTGSILSTVEIADEVTRGKTPKLILI